MKKAGGIISIIAGIFGVFSAILTLLIGGAGAAFNANGANTIVGIGFGGITFSFLIIVFGAVCLFINSRVPGILLIIASVLGIFLGGGIVAAFMILSLIGGILAVFSKNKIKEIT